MSNLVYNPQDFKLTTAEILYHMPDHYSLLQAYIWQELDISPDFPVLMRFLQFWESHLEGKVHSVTVSSAEILEPEELKYYTYNFRLH